MFFFVLFSADATTNYVDSSATGANNGTSWADAWTNMSATSGVKPGDVVIISGGPSGSSRIYASGWHPLNGAAGQPIIYQIGQDAAHNGTAIFQGGGSPLWTSSSLIHDCIFTGDAKDGNRHFILDGFSCVVAGPTPAANLRISYLTLTNLAAASNGREFDFGNVTNLEVEHIWHKEVSTTANQWMNISQNTGYSWDQGARLHDITIYLPTSSTQGGFGGDGIDWGGGGISVYNCQIYGYFITNYTGNQHQDGIQPLGGDYNKVYNNVFCNLANYDIFFDAAFSVSFNHLWIYNNIVVNFLSGSTGGIVVGSKANTADVIIANNVSQCSSGQNISFGTLDGSSNFVNCLVANNVVIDDGIHLPENTTTPLIDNVMMSSAAASTNFISYKSGNVNFDFHLLTNAVSLIGRGTNLSSYFTTDKDGNARPATGAWDIGPYQYQGTASNPPSITSQPAGVTNNTVYGFTLTVGATGTPPLTYNWYFGASQVQSGSSSTYSPTLVSTNQSGNYQVVVTNLYGVVTSSIATVLITNGVVPPSAPTNLSASAVSPSEIDLSWTASTPGSNAIAGYYIYVNGATTPTASVATTSYRSTNLSANTTYSYAVAAYDTAGNQSQQSTVSATTWPPLSTKFSLNQQVQVLATANVRQQPTNEVAGSVLGTQAAGAVATVVGGPIYAALNGVYYYWWNLSFSSSPSGWVAEDNLQAYSAPTSAVIQVTPGSLTYGTVLVGTEVTNSFTVANVGVGMLSGAASVGLPFSIVSGGSYTNLGSNQSQTVVVVFSPTVASNYSRNVNFTVTGGVGTNVSVTGSATNAPAISPVVSAISVDATDVDLNLAGLQIYSGTTVHFSATATNTQTWQWSYAVNGGAPVVYTNGTSPITNISFYFDTNTVGNSYVWTLVVSNGQAWAESQTNLAVEAPPNPGGTTTNLVTGPTITATSGTISGLLTASTVINGVSTKYVYQPLPLIGSISGGTATYNVTITNAGNYEIEALVNTPNLNANSFLVNVDSQPQNPTMIWDIMPITSGFEQRIVSWRGNGSENNDQIVPVVFTNLSAGSHKIIFVGREPGTRMASFTLLQVVISQPQSPPAAPSNLRIISSSP